RHTRFSRDWSSDVCSSDLFSDGIAMQEQIQRIRADQGEMLRELRLAGLADAPDAFGRRQVEVASRLPAYWNQQVAQYADSDHAEIGRASCREREELRVHGE